MRRRPLTKAEPPVVVVIRVDDWIAPFDVDYGEVLSVHGGWPRAPGSACLSQEEWTREYISCVGFKAVFFDSRDDMPPAGATKLMITGRMDASRCGAYGEDSDEWFEIESVRVLRRRCAPLDLAPNLIPFPLLRGAS